MNYLQLLKCVEIKARFVNIMHTTRVATNIVVVRTEPMFVGQLAAEDNMIGYSSLSILTHKQVLLRGIIRHFLLPYLHQI